MLKSGDARHHIIPIKQMQEIGLDIVNDKDIKSVDLDKIIHAANDQKKKVKFTTPTPTNKLAEYLVNGKALGTDEEMWFKLIAWLPGNMVVGPNQAHRLYNSNKLFDEEAFSLLRRSGNQYRDRCDAIEILRYPDRVKLSEKIKHVVTLASGIVNTVVDEWKLKDTK